MSLLLDALKKAADEKKKGDDESVDRLIDQSMVDDVDLNLELEEAPEEFPEVKDEIVKPVSEVEEKSFRTESTVQKDVVAETFNVADKVELALQDEEALSGTTPQSSDQNKQHVVEVKSFGSDEKHQSDRQPDIQNEKALSALINKGNQASLISRSKTQRLAAVIIILLFMTVVSYLYFRVNNSAEAVKNAAVITEQSQIELSTKSNVPDVAETKIPELVKAISQQAELTEVANAKVMAPRSANQTKTKSVDTLVNNKITIIHKQVDDPIDVLIRKAYAAFNQDQIKQSETLYQQVIRRDSKNRDALLGLAAIAVKQQRFEYARQKYSELLKLNPKDSFARAGLSSVENQSNARFNESRLKLMISDEPTAAHLYFALGNLYAAEDRWPEAQTAYFSAWSAANTSSDYAYNLAVSLDHLGKLNNAKDFYSLSLKLQQASGGNIPVEDIKSRISSIESAVNE